MVRVLKKGTPLLAQGQPLLSVLSYNLLAPLYVRPVDRRTGGVQSFAAFEWASDAALDWATRQPKLHAERRNGSQSTSRLHLALHTALCAAPKHPLALERALRGSSQPPSQPSRSCQARKCSIV